MKDLLKTYAPIVAILAGAIGYWVWGQVSNLSEINASLMERNTQLELALANQCTTLLEVQGFTVTPPEPSPEPVEEDGKDGEDTR